MRRVGNDAAGAAVHEVDALDREAAGQLHALVRRPAALHPVGAGQAGEQRQMVGPLGLDRADDLQREPDSLLEPAAVSVVAPVGERARGTRAPGSRGRSAARARESRAATARRVAAANARTTAAMSSWVIARGTEGPLRERNRARGDGLPAAGRDLHAGAALPGNPVLAFRPAWASCTPGTAPGPRGSARCGTGTRCGRPSTDRDRAGDPPSRLDRRGLGHHQPCAPHCARAEVHQMPIVGEAVLGAVLAHRRDADAVGQRDGAEREWFEEVGHGAES